jgi:anti-sigma regulatory factor (Ser/Thr protein kinase)
MAADARVFSLTLPSNPRVLSVARTFVEAVGQACSLDRGILHALVTAAGEAVTNIIRHAHRNLPAAQLHLQLHVQPDCVVLTFQDQGEPFDIANVPHMKPGELRIGGRGVFLMRALMDEVTCEPCLPGQRGNTLRLVKRCAGAGQVRTCG